MNNTIRNVAGVLLFAALAAVAADYGVAALLTSTLARADAPEFPRATEAEPCGAPARDANTARLGTAPGASAVADGFAPERAGGFDGTSRAAEHPAPLQWAVSCEPAACCNPRQGAFPENRGEAQPGAHVYF